MRGGSNERSDGPSSGSAARRPAPGFGGNCAPRRRRFRRVGAVPRRPPSRPRGSGGGTRGRSRRRRRDHRAARGGRGRHRLRWFGRFGPVGPEPVGPDCGSNGTHCGAGRFATGARWGRSCTQHFQRPGRRIIRRSHRDGRHRGGRLACAEQSGRAEFHRAWFHRAWFQHASRRRLRHRQRLRRHERRSGDQGAVVVRSAPAPRRTDRTGPPPRRVRLGPRSVWPGR